MTRDRLHAAQPGQHGAVVGGAEHHGPEQCHPPTKTGVTLPAGQHVLKLVVDANGSGGTAADINWFAIR